MKSALLFLGLCTPDYRPTEAFRRLVATPEKERETHWRALFEEHYRPLFGTMDLQRATRQEIREALARGGLQRETADRGVTFFFFLTRQAGVEVSDGLARRVVRRRQPDFSKFTSRNELEPRNVSETGPAVLATTPGDPPPRDLHPAVSGLLHLLPPAGQSWDASDRSLFLQTFAGAVTLAYRASDGAPPSA